jgi:uncharacterized protein YjeT (DUF2065 family)
MAGTLLMAFGLMLILEGAVPFIAPAVWRDVFRRIMAFTDGQLRFTGLASMLAGVALVALAR